MHEDEFILVINDDNKIEDEKKECVLLVEYEKSILLKNQMECGLIKLITPSIIYSTPFGTQLYIDLSCHFVTIDSKIHDPSNDPWTITRIMRAARWLPKKMKDFHFRYELKTAIDHQTSDPSPLLTELDNLSVEMNYQLRKTWNESVGKKARLDERNLSDIEKEVETFAWRSKTMKEVVYDAEMAWPGARDVEQILWKGKMYVDHLKILSDDKKNLELKQFRILVHRMSQHELIRIVYFGYIRFSPALHSLLGQDKYNFPIMKLYKEDTQTTPPPPPPTKWPPFLPEKVFPYRIDKWVFTLSGKRSKPIEYYKGSRISINFVEVNFKPLVFSLKTVFASPQVIKIYCNLLTEAYSNSKKENILQILYGDSSRMFEDENLIFMPVRIDEVSFVSISLYNEDNLKLFYHTGELTAVLKLRPQSKI